MNIINKLTLRHIAENKKRTIITVIGIIISVAMITAVTTSFQTFLNFFQQDKIRTSGNWHYQFSEVTPEEYDKLLKADNVGEVAIKNVDSRIKIGNEDINAFNSGILESINEIYLKNFNLTVTKGSFPKNKNEIIISKAFIDQNNLNWQIGDTVTIDKGVRIYDGEPIVSDYKSYISGEIFEKTDSAQYTISGFYDVADSNGNDSDSYKKINRVYTTFDTSSNQSMQTVFVKAEKLNHKIYDNIDSVAKEIGKNEENTVINTTLISFSGIFDAKDPFCLTMYGVLAVIMTLILIASVELIYNAFAFSLAEKSKYLGMLASVGATKSQKRASIYFEGLILGAIGIPLGLLAGTGAMAITFKAIGPLLTFEQFGFSGQLKYIVTFPALLAGIIISVITIAVSSYIPAKKASKTTAINAIRKTDSVKLKAKKLKTSKLTRKLFGFEGELALKNIKRTGRKSRIITASIALSVILFLTVNSFASLFGSSFNMMLNQYDHNYQINYKDEYSDEVKKGIDNYSDIKLKRFLSSDIITAENMASVRTEEFKKYIGEDAVDEVSDVFYVYSYDDESFKTFCKENGIDSKKYFDDNGFKAILLNSIQARDYDGKKFTTIKVYDDSNLNGSSYNFVVSDDDSEETKNVSLKISDVLESTESKSMTTGSIPILITTENNLKEILSGYRQTKYDSACLDVTDASAFDKYIKEYIKENSIPDVSCDNIEANANTMNNMFTIMYVFIYGFIVTMTLVSIANILNTISTGIENRRREFAMFKSVGLDKKGFRKMISFESIFYGLNALLYGLPISVALHFLLYYLLNSSTTIEFTFPWQMYIVVIVAVFAIVSLSLLLSVNKIKNDNIIETLKSDDN